tara:strand:+ start:5645 stop:6082 length:438 start_codon:yes stop_codon:yes gene_type:complete
MILISHRGNIDKKSLDLENKPDYIDQAIGLDYSVEVDIRVIEGSFYLGHDKPQYGVTQDWLNKRLDKLWIHCKNIEAVEWFAMIGRFNYFWHETDTLTLTSKGYIWVYPGKQIVKNSIAVLPEIFNDNISECVGICSDNIKNYKK